MSSTRDAQRSAVYAAEDQLNRLLDAATIGDGTIQLYGSTLTVPVERRFADIESIQRYVDLILDLPWVTERWGKVPPVQVRERKGQTRAHWQAPNTIAIPVEKRWALRETVVLHEVSHHLAHYAPNGGGDGGAHGALFTGILADLSSVVIGPEIGLLMRAGFDGAGVKVGVSPSPKDELNE